MAWKTLDDMDLYAMRIFVRVDLNVPVKDGVVTDTTRIEKIVPTVQDILAKGGKPVLLSHFGRPKGHVVPELSLRVVLPELNKALGKEVIFADGNIAHAMASMKTGDVVLVENLRFFPGEEGNDMALAEEMAGIAALYCNDAFSASHRAHMSVAGLPKFLPSCAGRLMEAELKALEAALGDPARPVVAVVGGAKVSTKLDLLGNLVEKVDHLIIGGGMANTFLAAKGLEIGTSLAEREMVDTAADIMIKAERVGCTIHLPKDVVVAREFAANAPNETVPAEACPADAMILDAGPQTVAALDALFSEAATVIWNGPLGAFELEPFDAATKAAAQAVARETRTRGIVSVAGGGDTVAALNAAGVAGDFTHVSTAGGAFLEWMEGKTLPGVAALLED